MRVASRSSNPARRSPQQDRSTRRVHAFLEAAEFLFAEVGFAGTTMTAVADRAESSVGALYSYFPDKKTIAIALLDVYAGKIEEHWRPLFDTIRTLDAEEFSSSFIHRFVVFIADNPAYLQLQAAPIQLRRSLAAKRAFRATLVNALLRRTPALSQSRAELHASVVLQLVRGMMHLYAGAAHAERPLVIGEFKKILAAYMASVFATK